MYVSVYLCVCVWPDRLGLGNLPAVSSPEKSYSPPSAALNWFAALRMGLGPYEISPIHTGIAVAVVNVQVLLRQPYC